MWLPVEIWQFTSDITVDFTQDVFNLLEQIRLVREWIISMMRSFVRFAIWVNISPLRLKKLNPTKDPTTCLTKNLSSALVPPISISRVPS
jgi:hypothetical protein